MSETAASERAAAHSLAAELRAYPGRWNVALRCLLSCAIVIVVSQTLQVPFLAVSLFIVFFATQANLVLTRLVGLMIFLGITLAIAAALLLAKFTFGYPAWRLVVVAALLLGCLFLMRASKLGPVFYIVALVITAVQGYFDLIPSAELMARAILWAWVAAVYPLATCVLINSLLLPAEPLLQLKAEAHRQLRQVDGELARAAGERSDAPALDADDLPRGVLAVQKLLRFAWMRDKAFQSGQARHLLLAAALSSLREQALQLAPAGGAAAVASIAALRAAVARLDECIQAETPFDLRGLAVPDDDEAPHSPSTEMWHTLRALSERSAPAAPAAAEARGGLLAADARSNPVYVRFALKTVLAMMLCYVFYVGVDWTGIHTVMMTCLIVAQPSLGASSRKVQLRVIGALIGGALALLLTVFVIPQLDTIVGLLLISLPVLAASAYLSAGSERISYAGMQIMFTFSLAILGDFSASTDLSGIRDRLVGIGLGIAVSYLVHTLLWPESEGRPLAQQIGALLRSVAQLLGERSDTALAGPVAASRAWAALGSCEETLSRVAFEPNWQQNEGEHEETTLRLQSLIEQAREILLDAGALRRALDAHAGTLDAAQRDALAGAQADVAARLRRYADELAASGDMFHALAPDAPLPVPPPAAADDAYDLARRPLCRLAARVQYLTTSSAPTDESYSHREAAYT